MKIAVTGANGFIGSRLCRYLSEKGFEVVCLVRETSDTSLLGNMNIRRINYGDKEMLSEALLGVDVLVHLAALTRARKWDEFKKVNVDFVKQLVEISNESTTIKQFIFMSSQAASGPSKSASGKLESEKCRPVTMYGRSKLKAERVIKSRSEKPWTIFRAVSVFGPGEQDFLEYYKIIKKGIAPLVGMRHKYLSLIYVDDLCRMISLAIGNEEAGNEIFFASGSEEISMAGFAWLIAIAMEKSIITIRIPEPFLWISALILELVSKASKRPPVLNREKFREMRQRYWLADNSKAVKLLGFSQDATLVKQMHTTINWYKKQGIL